MIRSTLGIISANYTKKDLCELAECRTVATIPFGGRYRLIDFPLSNFVNSGITTVGLITPYHYRSIMDHIGAGKPWELARKTGGLFILPGTVYGEREEGSIFLLRDIINNRRILDRSHSEFVIICDSSTVMNCDFEPFIEAHAASGCPVTLMYKKALGKNDHCFIKIKKNGLVSGIYGNEKKEGNLFLNCFIINREFLLRCLNWYSALDNNDLIYLLSKDLDKHQINTYEYKGYAAAIDSVADYKKASEELLEREARVELFEQDRLIYTKIQDEAPTIYKPTASVKRSLVAAGCIIEGTVENSIVFRSAHIKPGAVVKNSIIMQRTVIETNATVINTICDKYVHVGRKAHIEGGDDRPVVIAKDTIV